MDHKLEALLTAANDACIVIETLSKAAESNGDTQAAHWAMHRLEALRLAAFVVDPTFTQTTIRDTPDFPEDPEESPFAEPLPGAETSRQRIFQDIEAERAVQDAKWGGPDHDDEHDILDWVTYIGDHARRAGIVDPTLQRRQMVRVAALAVACVESLDRQGLPVTSP